MKYIISIIISLLLILKLSYGALNENVACIEGYYWKQEDSINGNYGQFTFTQRKQLIQLMGLYGIGVYWWSPQTVDTMKLWDATVVNEWKSIVSLGSDLGVKIVVGIRPGWLETSAFSSVLERLEQIHSTGVNYYTLNFDDGEGVDTTEQQQLEVQLVSYLQQNLPSEMKIYAMLPYAYHQDMFKSKTEWESALSILDTVSSNIPFVFTGSEITPSTFDSSQFPTLQSGRNLKFFDNWIAGDTSKRISWGMIDGRVNSNIFTSSYGYVLNLAFPLERIIHHLYCEGQLASGSTSCSVTTASQQWSEWLNSNGFLHESQTISNVQTSLEAAINQDQIYNSIDELYTAYPNLNGIFTTPPTNSDSTSTSNSDSTSASTSTSTSTSNSDSTSTSTSNSDSESTSQTDSSVNLAPLSKLFINSNLLFIILIIISLINQ